MASVDSGVETESESLNEDNSSSSLPPTPKLDDEGLQGVKQKPILVAGPPLVPWNIEPPAGLSFDNIQPCLSFGQGYEALSHDYPSNISYQSLNCKMRASRGIRVVRFYQRSNARSWSKWKLYLGERKLRLAANTNDLDRLKALLESGIDPRSCDEFKRTALHLAASKGYTEIVRLLLHFGADPNQIDTLGNTPLHLAVCTNHVSVVTLLLRAGANIRLLDRMGRNPLQLAESKLKLLQKKNKGNGCMLQIQNEVFQVVEMLKTYLEKAGQDEEAELGGLLETFSERLTINQNSNNNNSSTNSDMENSVRQLLASLTALNLKKESDN